MNWSIIGFIVLIWLIIIAFGVMIYFEYIDPLRRQAQWRREQKNNASTHTSYPDAHTTTWVLDTKFRELSDEEILEEWFYKPGQAELWEIKEVLNFARTVIRKAQEK